MSAKRRAELRATAVERQPPSEKRCPRCEVVKPSSEFGRDPNVRSGLKAYCTKCLREAARERTRKDPEKHREQVRQYRKNNPERARKVARDRMRAWRAKNLEQQRAYAREYHKRRWREDAEYRERFKRANATRRKRARGGTLTPAQWDAMLDFYEGTCLICGSGPATMDHVIPLSKGGVNAIGNVQPLCLICNSRRYNDDTDYRDPDLHAAFLEALDADGLL